MKSQLDRYYEAYNKAQAGMGEMMLILGDFDIRMSQEIGQDSKAEASQIAKNIDSLRNLLSGFYIPNSMNLRDFLNKK